MVWEDDDVEGLGRRSQGRRVPRHVLERGWVAVTHVCGFGYVGVLL